MAEAMAKGSAVLFCDCRAVVGVESRLSCLGRREQGSLVAPKRSYASDSMREWHDDNHVTWGKHEAMNGRTWANMSREYS